VTSSHCSVKLAFAALSLSPALPPIAEFSFPPPPHPVAPPPSDSPPPQCEFKQSPLRFADRRRQINGQSPLFMARRSRTARRASRLRTSVFAAFTAAMIAPARPPGQQNRWTLSPPPGLPAPPHSFSESALPRNWRERRRRTRPRTPAIHRALLAPPERRTGRRRLPPHGKRAARELLGGGRARMIAKSKDRHGQRLFTTKSRGACSA
jgi:hypothetical protein